MRKKALGPAVVAIGGGSGLSAILRGLKEYTEDLTAVVAVSDDGGGSGVLREDLGMPPPGDIRNCMEALADRETLMQQLLGYRFSEGRLAGQAFGNLLLAAMNGISDSFDQAVARMSQVLAITGQVLPVTNANVQLEATFENGSSICGESRICAFKKQQRCGIHHVRLVPEWPAALPAALDAIAQADVILLGPGSLYTSVIPNLLVDGISNAIRGSGALKIYVCNIMTQEGETEGMSAAEHVAALLEHGGAGLVHMCLCSSDPVQPGLVERYSAEYARPIQVNRREIEALGVELVSRSLSDTNSPFARHCGEKLARVVMELHENRAATKIF